MEAKLAKRVVSVDLDPGVDYYPIKKGALVKFDEQLIKQAIFGDHVQTKLTENTIGLEALEADLRKQYKAVGSITTLGGRTIAVDSPHKMLNYSCQGQGAEAMKYYLVEIDKQFKLAGLKPRVDFIQQAVIYDEVDLIAKSEHVELIKHILTDAFATISRQLGMKGQYTGEASSGPSWHECH